MSKIEPNFIKTCWLSGMSKEDCAALLIHKGVISFGIVREAAIYNAIDAVYDTLTVCVCGSDINTHGMSEIVFFLVCEGIDKRRNKHA